MWFWLCNSSWMMQIQTYNLYIPSHSALAYPLFITGGLEQNQWQRNWWMNVLHQPCTDTNVQGSICRFAWLAVHTKLKRFQPFETTAAWSFNCSRNLSEHRKYSIMNGLMKWMWVAKGKQWINLEWPNIKRTLVLTTDTCTCTMSCTVATVWALCYS